MEIIKVMAVADNEAKRFEIKSLLTAPEIAFVGFSKNGIPAIEKAVSLRANVLLMYYGAGETDTIEVAERIYTSLPGCAVIILCDTLDISVVERAMNAGVRKVICLPVDQKYLIENIILAYNMEKARAKNDNKVVQSWKSKIITVFGTKGGVGKTTISVNLAVALAKSGSKVALIDTDLQFGDVNVYLDIEPKETIGDLVQDRSTFDIETLKSFMMLHSSGVSVLCGTKSPEFADFITSDHIDKILNTLRPYYDYIIIDSSTNLDDISIATMDGSDIVLMLVSLDIVTIRNAKISMDVIERLQQKDKVRLVINRNFDSEISVKDVQRILGMPVIHSIPSDFKTAVSSLNKGIPLVVDAPRSTIGSMLLKLGEIIKKQ